MKNVSRKLNRFKQAMMAQSPEIPLDPSKTSIPKMAELCAFIFPYRATTHHSAMRLLSK